MASRPQNIGEVLAGAASAGLGFAGQNYLGEKQQEKQNALSQFMAIQQAQEAERAIEMHGLRMAQGRQAMVGADKENQKSSLELAAMVDPVGAAEKEARAKVAGEAVLLSGRLGNFQSLEGAGGIGFQSPGFSMGQGGPSYTAPAQVDPLDAEIKRARLASLEATTEKKKGGGGLTPYQIFNTTRKDILSRANKVGLEGGVSHDIKTIEDLQDAADGKKKFLWKDTPPNKDLQKLLDEYNAETQRAIGSGVITEDGEPIAQDTNDPTQLTDAEIDALIGEG